jgi:hypothetical protein
MAMRVLMIAGVAACATQPSNAAAMQRVSQVCALLGPVQPQPALTVSKTNKKAISTVEMSSAAGVLQGEAAP